MGDDRELTETVSAVQPGAAVKRYRCPGCEGMIERGVFHLVIVPGDAPDLRRHWHRGCWDKELRRRGRPVGEPLDGDQAGPT